MTLNRAFMNKKGEITPLHILIVFLLIVLVSIFLARLMASYTDENYDVYCEEVYGENFVYGKTDSYDVQKCMEVEEEGIINEYYFTDNQYDEICENYNFLDLTKWEDTCKK